VTLWLYCMYTALQWNRNYSVFSNIFFSTIFRNYSSFSPSNVLYIEMFSKICSLFQARPEWAQCAVCAVLSTKLSRHFDLPINKLIRTCERNLVAFNFLCCLNHFVLYFGRAWFICMSKVLWTIKWPSFYSSTLIWVGGTPGQNVSKNIHFSLQNIVAHILTIPKHYNMSIFG
jgi:hypothetical protein